MPNLVAKMNVSLRALRRAISGRGIGWVQEPLQGSKIGGADEQPVQGHRRPLHFFCNLLPFFALSQRCSVTSGASGISDISARCPRCGPWAEGFPQKNRKSSCWTVRFDGLSTIQSLRVSVG